MQEYLRGGLTILGALPRPVDAIYYLGCALMVFVLWSTTMDRYGVRDALTVGRLSYVQVTGLIAGLGPIVWGWVLLILTGDNRSPVWPFHKDSFVRSLGPHLLAGYLLCALPVTLTVTMLLGEPNQSVYFQSMNVLAQLSALVQA